MPSWRRIWQRGLWAGESVVEIFARLHGHRQFQGILLLSKIYKAGSDVQLDALAMEMSGCASYRTLRDGSDPRRPAGYDRGATADIVRKLCQEGRVIDAVEGLECLVHTERSVSRSLVYAVLKQCIVKKDLHLGRRVHALAVRKGYQSDPFLAFHMLRMYASHGRLQDAMDVFEAVVEPDAFTWSGIISAHVKCGKDKQAVELYHRMRRSSVRPDGHVFVAALQACAKESDVKSGQQVHADVLASGVEPDLFVCSCLVDMYAKCGSLENAQRVFDGLAEKNVVTWNAMIAGYSQQGMGLEALNLFSAMREEGVAVADSVTYACLLQACASVGIAALEKGRQFHVQIREQGHASDVYVASSLVNMYAKCGSLSDAQRVFDGLAQKDVVTWNALMAGYSQQSMGQEALCLYSAMQELGYAVPDPVTFVCLLHACASVGTQALETGKELHAEVTGRGLEADAVVANSLVNMYVKCGSLEDAQRVFDGLSQKNVVTWTAMIAGYSQQGMGQEALSLYSAMQNEGIAAPNAVTFVCLLQACASLGPLALEKGRKLHLQIRELDHEADVFVASSLVNMYAKCGSLKDAQRVFDGLDQKDVVTWSAMIAGYSQQGMGQEALHLYNAMQDGGMAVLDSVTFVCLLQACANVAALSVGRQLHAQIIEQGLQADVFVAVSLINMYGKSGSMVEAQKVFDSLPERDIVVWNALIASYASQGEREVVFDLFQKIKDDGVRPNSITFLSVLTVCSHAGLVTKGWEYFQAMSRHYGVTPSENHYTCMVDLLGRAGQLDEALGVVRTMPVLASSAVWHTLLAACQKWSNVEVGQDAFNEAVKLDKKDAAAYVLMSNIYTGAQLWDRAQKMQERREEMMAWKQPGQSWWADKDGLVHSFLVGDENHPQSQARLKQVFSKMERGCDPHRNSAPHSIDASKEHHSSLHRTKLAILYAPNNMSERISEIALGKPWTRKHILPYCFLSCSGFNSRVWAVCMYTRVHLIPQKDNKRRRKDHSKERTTGKSALENELQNQTSS